MAMDSTVLYFDGHGGMADLTVSSRDHALCEDRFLRLDFAAASGDADVDVMLDDDGYICIGERAARAALAKLTAWLDAPRLAARDADAGMVAQSEGYVLLRTEYEWGVAASASDQEDAARGAWDGEPTWFSGPDAERTARRLYAEERGKLLCECDAEVDEDDAVSDDGGVTMCPVCATAAREEWAAADVKCNGEDGMTEPCSWTGKGAAAIAGGHCPNCGGTVEEVSDVARGPAAARVVVPAAEAGDRPRRWYWTREAAEKGAALGLALHRISAADMFPGQDCAWAVVFADPAMDATVPPRAVDDGEVAK